MATGAVVVLLLAFAAFGLWQWLEYQYRAPGPAGVASRIEVAPGVSVRSVLRLLEKQGAVHDARAVQWYLRLRGDAAACPGGNLRDSRARESRRDHQAVHRRQGDARAAHRRRGLDVRAISWTLLAQEPDVQHTLAGKTAAQVMAALGHPGENPEGRFFPDTYRFAANTTDAAILERRLSGDAAGARCRLERTRVRDCRSTTPDQALILASIVEKETGARGRAGADRRGVRRPPAQRHAAAVRSDGDLRPGRRATTATSTRATWRPIRPTTPTRARACRRRRSRSRAAPRCTRRCTRRTPATLYFVATGTRRRRASVLRDTAPSTTCACRPISSGCATQPRHPGRASAVARDHQPWSAGASSRSKASRAPASPPSPRSSLPGWRAADCGAR